MPLAFTQQDFLVVMIFMKENTSGIFVDNTIVLGILEPVQLIKMCDSQKKIA